MTDQDPSSPKRITLKEKFASLDPARREKIEAQTEEMYDDLRAREAILDQLVEDRPGERYGLLSQLQAGQESGQSSARQQVLERSAC
jgi:hypothetical protein